MVFTPTQLWKQYYKYNLKLLRADSMSQIPNNPCDNIYYYLHIVIINSCIALIFKFFNILICTFCLASWWSHLSMIPLQSVPFSSSVPPAIQMVLNCFSNLSILHPTRPFLSAATLHSNSISPRLSYLIEYYICGVQRIMYNNNR